MAKLGFNVAKEKAEEANKTTTKYSYFKLNPNEEPTRIRFITVDGPEGSILTYGEHFLKFKNTWSRPFSCPDYGNEDGIKECKICMLDKGPGSDIIADQYSTKFIMQLIERGTDGEEDTIKVYKFGPFLFTTLLGFYEETGDLGDRDYLISLIKEPDDKGKARIRYEMKPASRKAEPLSEADKALIETRAKLTDIEPPYDMNEVRRLAQMEAVVDKPTNNNTSSIINGFLESANKIKPKAEAESVVTIPDDDEDDEDFFKILAKNQKK